MTYTYNSAPTATALTPAFGPVAGGTTVSITGSGFVSGTTTVTIGGTTAPASVTSPTELTFVTPAHASGAVDVVVATTDGDSDARSSRTSTSRR